MRLRIILVFSLIALSSLASTGKELIYGPEWTFTKPGYADSKTDFTDYDLEKLEVHFIKLCKSHPKCRHLDKESGDDRKGFRLQIGSELFVTIGTDLGVFEIQATPKPLTFWEKNEVLIQELIFDEFAKLGLKPHEIEGAGHINIGLDYFKGRTLLLANFISDFYNHTGVGIVLNSLKANEEDSKFLHNMNAGKGDHYPLFEKHFRYAFSEFEKNISNPDYEKFLMDVGLAMRIKHAALGLRDSLSTKQNGMGLYTTRVVEMDSSRLEDRTHRPQANMREFILALRMREARIKFLETKYELIPLNPSNAHLDGWKALGEFARSLTETGLDWREFKPLIPAVWRNLPEENFVPKPAPAPRSCRRLLN